MQNLDSTSKYQSLNEKVIWNIHNYRNIKIKNEFFIIWTISVVQINVSWTPKNSQFYFNFFSCFVFWFSFQLLFSVII